MERTPLLSHLKRLAGHSAVYGSADVASQVINLLLTPLYVTFLATAEFGILANLTLFSAIGKIVFRMGLESGFFRIHYDLKTAADRRGLAGTVAVFAALVGAVLLALLTLGAPLLARLILGAAAPPGASRLIVLAAADIYVGTFLFVPLSLLRIQNRPGFFSALIAARNLVNTVAKVLLVLAGWGVTGVLWSDLAATVLLALALVPTLVAGARPAFSWAWLRAVLAFGLPKSPHGFLVQILNLADRRLLTEYSGLTVAGIYDKAYVLGAGVKFLLTPFETAWAPFVYSQARRPDAALLFARVVTYAWAAFLALGLAVAVLGRELLITFTFTNPQFWGAATIVPIVTLAYLFHGAFLLTSIGIGIERKTQYYPLVTGVAATVNLGANLVLIPRWGMLAAAWTTVLSYGLMAGLGFFFSRRVYPIPFEAGRLVRLSLAAVLTFLLCCALAPVPVLGDETAGARRSVALFLTEVAPRLLPAVAAKLLLLATFPALITLFGVIRREEWEWIMRRAGRRVLGASPTGQD